MMRIFRWGWRSSWPGRLLRIHSPKAHIFEQCWCKGTKYEIFPEQRTVPKVMGEIKEEMDELQVLRLFLEANQMLLDSYCSNPDCKECSASSGNGQSTVE